MRVDHLPTRVLSVTPAPSPYEVDARGRRIENRADSAPGSGLVRLATILDVGALAGLVAHLALLVNEVPAILLLAGCAGPAVALTILYLSSASGMEDMTLRVRRIVGFLVPAMVLATAVAKERLASLVGSSVMARLPLLTMPFGAYAAHRALALAAQARARADAGRREARAHVGGGAPAVESRDARFPVEATARPWSVLGRVVLGSGFVLVVAGVVEAMRRVWWFGLLWGAAGVLCLARARELGAPSSEWRLRRVDRANDAVWALAALGALVAAARSVWILSSGS